MCLACNPGLLTAARAGTSRRGLLRGAAATALAVGLGTRSTRAQDGGPAPAEIIFRDGPILTMSAAAPRAEALAIGGGRILAVGSAADVDGLRGPSTRLVNLDGRALLPGLIDAHMHFAFAFFDDWLDVSVGNAPSMEALFARLRDGAGRAGVGGWVRAQLFDPSITTGGRAPTLAELDAAAPANPLFLFESNGHVAYANSTALRLAGVTRDTPDPPTGRYVRAPDGALTGRLEEPPTLLPFLARMPQVGTDELRRRVRLMMDRAAAAGCTALHDNGIGMLHGTDDLALLQAVMQDDPPVRYRGVLVSTEMDAWERMGLQPGFGDDRFRVNGIKAWSDGSNQAYTGFQRENYLGRDGRGALNYTQEQLTEAVRRAHRQGWQVSVHANGDAGIDTTIDAYAAVLGEMPRADHRHRIEHCSILHPDQIARMRELGLSPSFLIGHVRWWGRAFHDRILGPERARFLDPCASALAGGLRVSLHSDYNVTPIEPLRYVEDAVARVMNEGGGVLAPEQRISVEAALRAVTVDAAWQCRMDDIAGSLEPGKHADLAILESDPTAVEPTAIAAIKVSETWLGGVQRHAA